MPGVDDSRESAAWFWRGFEGKRTKRMTMEWTKFPLFVIAGPCVIESEELCMAVAGEGKRGGAKLGVGYVFKASFDKANRSSATSYRGSGVKEGIAVLKRVKEKYSVPVLTDV